MRRLSQTQALLGTVTPGGAVVWNENAESCGVDHLLRILLVILPIRRTYVVIVRGNDELLCGGYKSFGTDN